MNETVAEIVAYYGNENMIYLSGSLTYLFFNKKDIFYKKDKDESLINLVIGSCLAGIMFQLFSLLLPPNIRFIIPMCTIIPLIGKFIINSFIR